VTKAVPKELLPIVDVPAIQINVEECVASGIRDLILITSRGKDALIDYFDRGAELEELLERKGKHVELEMIRRLTDLAHISAIRQAEARGFGSTRFCAPAAWSWTSPSSSFWAMIWSRVTRRPAGNCLTSYAPVWQGRGGLWEVPPGQEHLYGIVDGESVGGGVFRLHHLVEKPEPGQAPSRLAIVVAMSCRPRSSPSWPTPSRTEVVRFNLTDALATCASHDGLYGVKFAGPACSNAGKDRLTCWPCCAMRSADQTSARRTGRARRNSCARP